MDSSLYRERTDNKKAFAGQVFKLFTNAINLKTEHIFANVLYGKYEVESFSYGDDYNYHQVLGYFTQVVIPHKIAVFNAGVEFLKNRDFLGFIAEGRDLWVDNLWIHDMSKFSANEAFGYAFHDFKSKKEDIPFERAWNHHKNHNPHHPEYWLSVNKEGDVVAMEMPRIYVAEMVADWIGAGMVYGSSLEQWLPNNLHRFKWHGNTALSVWRMLKMIGIETELNGSVLTCK